MNEVAGEEDGLRRLHAELQRVLDELAAFGLLPDGISTMSAFAFGEAMGTLSKAKAQVGRDIDERGRDA